MKVNVQEIIQEQIKAINGEREAVAKKAIRQTLDAIIAQHKVIADAEAEIIRLKASLTEVKVATVATNIAE